MRYDIGTELKELRLHGMAAAWDELIPFLIQK